MKKITSLCILVFISLALHANVVTVTSNSDDKTNPTHGMLRYFVENSANGDTIRFAVDSVGLDTTIRISYKQLTIDGGDGVIIDGGSNGSVLSISADMYSEVLIKGLVIQNGYGDNYGGGAYVFLTDDVVTFENCIFKNNTVYSTSDSQGGGVRTNGGTFKNCSFLNNQAAGTTTVRGGGGAFAIGGQFINCVFAGNSANYGGGLYASDALILNCTFTQNIVETAGNGAGISIEDGCEVTNSIVYNNKANNVENNIDNYNSTVAYCAVDFENTLVGTNGNIGLSETPFRHNQPDSLSLKSGSECINAGNSLVDMLPEGDITGSDRIFGGNVDIGAYEASWNTIISGSVKFEDNSLLTDHTLLPGITTDGVGNYEIVSGVSGFEVGDTLELSAPLGFEFYPKKIIIGLSDQVIDLVAYKGIVIDNSDFNTNLINWDADTINVFCDIILDSINLTISPNSRVRFHGYYGIRVSGTGSIKALGTFHEPVIFTSADTTGIYSSFATNTTGAWNRITFNNMSENADSSIFNFCTVEYSLGLSSGGHDGGGVEVTSFNKIQFSNCRFLGNKTRATLGISSIAGGGALKIFNSKFNIINCSFIDNHSYGDNYNIMGGGGAIHVNKSNLKIINSNFIRNHAFNEEGGAIHAYYAEVDVYNSIFYESMDHYGNYSFTGSQINLYNSNIEEGSDAFVNNMVDCVVADPLFTDPLNGDFSLQVNSPCINGGNLNPVLNDLPEVDIIGNNRIHQQLVDIGATEYQSDIPLHIIGVLAKEDGTVLPDFEILPGITTNESGEFDILAETHGYSIGDTLAINNPAGYEIYPSHIIVGWDKPRSITLTAYNGIVVDEFDKFEGDMIWNDTVHVFTDIKLTTQNLTIKEGTIIRFHTYSGLYISQNASIQAQGTHSDSIIFTTAYPALANPSTSILNNCWKGINFENGSQDSKISHLSFCKIEYVKKETDGGAFYFYYFDNVKVEFCELSNNRARFGPGMYMYNSAIEVSNCIIKNNIASVNGGWGPVLGGGGLYIDHSNPIITGCLIHDNDTWYHGGGILMRTSNPTIINCSIINNAANGDGESVWLYQSSPKLYNTIMIGSHSNQLEAYEIDEYSQSAEIYNSCIRGGNAISAEKYVENIDDDPLFTDPLQQDYSLQSGSPCINKGTHTFPIDIGDSDVARNNRVYGKIIDMGAIEFPETSLYATAGDAVVDIPVQFSGEILLGTVSSWSWDFNNDGIEDSNMQNPEYTYSDTGSYEVKLIANIEETGQNDTVLLEVFVYDPVAADFDVSSTCGSATFIVKFTDQSANNPTSWHWDFGDGSTSSEQHPVHFYEQTGQYTVTQVVTNDGSSDTITKNDIIEVLEGYLMKNGEYTTNSGFFYDNGGMYNDYTGNSHEILTFYPNTPKTALTFTFEMFELSHNTWFKVFDGSSTSAPLIGEYNYYSDDIDKVAATNPDGALTFEFSSTSTYIYDPGWRARISTCPMFEVTMKVNSAGSLSGDSSQLILQGLNSAGVTAVPDYGYHFTHWETAIGDSLTHLNPLTISGVTNDTTVYACFEKNAYHVTFTSGTGGYIEGEDNQDVLYNNSSSEVLAIADEGYHFAYWENLAGDSVTNINPVAITGVNKDKTVKAVFDKNIYNLSFISNSKGFIEGENQQQVLYEGISSEVKAVAREGYHFTYWESLAGDSITNVNPIAIIGVNKDTTFKAVFDKNIYNLSFISNSKGFIEGENQQQAFYEGRSSEVKAVANVGYHFAYWATVDSDSVSHLNPIAISLVSSDTVLYAVFEKNIYSVSILSTGKGSVEGSTDQLVEFGENSSEVTALADEGYHFSYWESPTGDSVTNNNPLILENVVSDTVLHAVFDINTFNVTFTAAEGGYIEGETEQIIIYNEKTSEVTAVADNGNRFKYWATPEGDSLTDENPLIVQYVTSDSSCVAVFEEIRVSVPDFFASTIHIYPNPVSNRLVVEAEGVTRIELLSITGESLQVFDSENFPAFIDMTPYNNGIYILVLNAPHHRNLVKIIKE
ncbi:MAG: InlB B-repeat-containing protein [Cyclobacteriaceae bacterium]